MSHEPSPLPPFTARTWLLSDGRAVLRFRPVHWDHYSQRLEIIIDDCCLANHSPCPRRSLPRSGGTAWS